MPNYVIVTDSGSDMPANLIGEYGVTLLPLQFTIDNHEYFDDPLNRDISFEDFFAMMRQGYQSKTAQVNILAFNDAFETILQQGQDLIYIGLSSKISGTYNSAFIAAQELTAKYPDRTILTIDSKAASLGLTLLVDYAVRQQKQGKTIHELYDWVTAQIPQTCHWFTVDDLVYLKRGGRVSSLEAIIGKTLNIKPVLHVDNEGALIPISKVRGRKQSLDALFQKMVDFCSDRDHPTAYISHADAYEDALFLEKSIKSSFPDSTVHISMIGPVIGSHAGPGTIALFFFGPER